MYTQFMFCLLMGLLCGAMAEEDEHAKSGLVRFYSKLHFKWCQIV